MDKIKRDFADYMLKFVNQDIKDLTDLQCQKLATAMQKKALIPFDAISPVREYSGGVTSRHINVNDPAVCRKFLETLNFRINLLLTGRDDEEDFGDRRINYTLLTSDKFSLRVAPVMSGPDSDVYMLLVGLAWALHGLPVDRIKKCLWCGHIFLQTTRRNKECCSKQCADRRVDARRQGTPERKEVQGRASEKQRRKKLPGYEPIQAENGKNRKWIKKGGPNKPA